MSKLKIALIGNGGICRGSHINNYCEDCGAVLGSGNITIKSIEEEDTTTVE